MNFCALGLQFIYKNSNKRCTSPHKKFAIKKSPGDSKESGQILVRLYQRYLGTRLPEATPQPRALKAAASLFVHGKEPERVAPHSEETPVEPQVQKDPA